jgi:hypothetical protein
VPCLIIAFLQSPEETKDNHSKSQLIGPTDYNLGPPKIQVSHK